MVINIYVSKLDKTTYFTTYSCEKYAFFVFNEVIKNEIEITKLVIINVCVRKLDKTENILQSNDVNNMLLIF